MTDDVLLERARRLWAGLAAAPVDFQDAAVRVAVSTRAWLCPPGWVGIVVLGGAAIAVAPDEDAAETVRHALAEVPEPTMAGLAAAGDRLPAAEVLGPASLAYVDTAGFRPAEARPAEARPAEARPAGARPAGAGPVEALPADHPGMATLLDAVPADEVDEASPAEITSPAFVVRSGADVVAMAGYRAWPRQVAHVSVLTAPAFRGRGHARTVASAAVAHALDAGLLPQWRARVAASRRVAGALGFRELGAQMGLRLH